MTSPYTTIGRRLKNNFRQFLLANSPQNKNYLANLFRVSPLVVLQCNSYGSLNARRFARIIQLYKKLYNQKSFCGLFEQLSLRFPSVKKSFKNLKRFFFVQSGTILSASIFSFNLHGIADEDMIEAATSLAEKQASTSDSDSNKENLDVNNSTSVPKLLIAKNSLLRHLDVKHWELVSEKEDLFIWRRKRLFSANSNEQSTSDSGALYEYKCAGRYTDVPAYGFLIAQMDLEYRKKWDNLVVCVDVLECDSVTGSEVIRWVTHFPYPMCPREYLYVRRACLDPITKCIILTSKTVANHPKCPRDDQKYVRVEEYFSSMIIKPHEDFNQNGFDYVLTYYDDPKAPFPSLAYNWMVTTGVPNFVQKVYKAAKALPVEKNVLDFDHEITNRRLDEFSSKKIPLTTNKTYDLPILKRPKKEKMQNSSSTDLDVVAAAPNPKFSSSSKNSCTILTDNDSFLLYG